MGIARYRSDILDGLHSVEFAPWGAVLERLGEHGQGHSAADESQVFHHGDPHLLDFVAKPFSQDYYSQPATHAGQPFGGFDTDLR